MAVLALPSWLRRKRVEIIELHGMISARGLSARAANPVIARAMRAARGGAVILDIDSPGGSPVQSELIASAIRHHAGRREVRVIAAIGEVGASGGYWLACAGDEIVASPMSVVGSIGVIGGGFGFVGLLDRLGVQRRLYTAGENKARLDPFSPERPEDVAFARRLMEDVHARFRDWVKQRRGERLRADDAALFDGGYSLGGRAVETGLVDRLGDLDGLVRELGGETARRRVWRPRRRRGLLARVPGLLVGAVVEAIEERLLRL